MSSFYSTVNGLAGTTVSMSGPGSKASPTVLNNANTANPYTLGDVTTINAKFGDSILTTGTTRLFAGNTPGVPFVGTVPAPSSATLSLIGIPLVGLGFLVRRRMNRKAPSAA